MPGEKLVSDNSTIPKGATIFCDVDDTLMDHYDQPKKHVIEALRKAKADGSKIYLWSQGGEDYCRRSAKELGIADLFDKFLDKPVVCIDDLEIQAKFTGFKWIHPIQLI